MIKILCVSDEVDPLVYSRNLKKRYGDVSFVIGAGDLRLPYYGFIVSIINKPLYFVFGNHHLKFLKDFSEKSNIYNVNRECPTFTKNYFGSTCIGEKIIRDKKSGLILMGFGGSYRYNTGEHQFTDAQMYIKMLARIPKMSYYRLRYGKWVDIIVTHASPFGIHDKEDLCHRGFKSFLWFMRVFKPKYLIHGHIHLLDANEPRETIYYNTHVINVFKSYILEIDDIK